jgi:uncharacterized protein
MSPVAAPGGQATGSIRATVGPVAPELRSAEVDIVRGFALFTVLLENMHLFGADSIAWRSATDRLSYAAMQFFVESKSWTLFAILFGWGFALQLERARTAGARILPTYLRRLAALFALGAANALLFDGDILMLYAELGLGLLVVRRLPTRGLLVLAVALLLAFPLVRLVSFEERPRLAVAEEIREAQAELESARSSHVYAVGTLAEVASDNADAIPADPLEDVATPESALAVFAMFLLGVSIGRSGVLRDIPGNAAPLARVRKWGLGLGFGAMAAKQVLATTAGYTAFGTQHAGPVVQLAGDLLFAYGTTALALGYAAALLLAAQTRRGRAVLGPLADVGRMSLSVYLTQTLMFTTLFYGYGFGQAFRLGPAAVTGWAAIFFAVQVVACRWWSRRFRFGPMEWLWRSLTYLAWQPMRLGGDAAR